jgi:hypothetical protein
MDFDEAREIVLQLLRAEGKAKNSEMLQALGSDEVLWKKVREDLLFAEFAEDIRGAGLRYTGPAQTSESVLPSMAVTSGRLVFVSYGRADATTFAKRLADDLKRNGHRIFLDLKDIKQGETFDTRIEQGIRQADVVTAVMTQRSLAVDSVCRDEVVFALQFGRPILPLRVVKDPDLKPTLLLARRNWIDFSEDYNAGLESLLRYLAGDKSTLRAPVVSMITGAVPLDFSADIARHCGWNTEPAGTDGSCARAGILLPRRVSEAFSGHQRVHSAVCPYHPSVGCCSRTTFVRRFAPGDGAAGHGSRAARGTSGNIRSTRRRNGFPNLPLGESVFAGLAY